MNGEQETFDRNVSKLSNFSNKFRGLDRAEEIVENLLN
jgi:hypothetical protein